MNLFFQRRLEWLYRSGYYLALASFLFSAARYAIKGQDEFFVYLGLGLLVAVPLLRGVFYGAELIRSRLWFLLFLLFTSYGLVFLVTFLKVINSHA